MISDLFDGETSFDFDSLANNLLEQGVSCSPSQMHGVLTGLLAAGSAPAPEQALNHLEDLLETSLHGELAGQVMDWYKQIAVHLSDEDFDFYPVLPDDEAEIEQRTTEMAAWCSGFLGGFARGIGVAGGQGVDGLPTEHSEILRDMAAIAQAGVGEDDEETLESSYTELVEYLRFAAMNLFLGAGEGGADSDAPVLH